MSGLLSNLSSFCWCLPVGVKLSPEWFSYSVIMNMQFINNYNWDRMLVV